MKQLRNISSRAEITADSFIKAYNYGDLKANPRYLMRQFFDIHVYLSNWGSAMLMLRLPREALDAETVNAFAVDGYFEGAAFMTEHGRRKALVTRLEKVGLRQVPM